MDPVLIFPISDPNIWFEVEKTPNFTNFTDRSASGLEVGSSCQAAPWWEFTFPYDCLRQADIELLYGFFCLTAASLGEFYLLDPLNKVTGLELTPVAGQPTQFQLYRNYAGLYQEYPWFPPLSTAGFGAGGYISPDVNGYGVQNWETPFLYVNGVLQTEGYDIAERGLITFESAPAANPTADFTFGYKARFKDDALKSRYYHYNLWKVDGITLVTKL